MEVRKLAPEAIARWGLHDVDYVVFEPFKGGLRVRAAALEDQVRYEQDGGLGRVTYSLGEFLDEFHDAPFNPAPTFDRLAQFKRDYRKLTREQRERFRAAAKKVIAPLSTTPPGEPTQPLVRELQGHPGFFEVYVDRDTRAVYTFGQAVRPGQPHIIWCRIGGQDALDKHTAVHAVVTEVR
jgi:mRNA-degrading endonuclease YafQ of YafQ-DinJ toxin-antitoxin module